MVGHPESVSDSAGSATRLSVSGREDSGLCNYSTLHHYQSTLVVDKGHLALADVAIDTVRSSRRLMHKVRSNVWCKV
jgi:hypothetical protein